MKKNKSMRAAGGLMIATMLTTSIVSGTYAKYVTSGTAKDTARVAKFGVVVKAEGSLFDKNYLETSNTPTDTDTGISVKSLSTPADNVVAPGTKNDTGLSFSITGTPEVDVNVKIEVANTSADIFLKEGTYPEMTTSADDDNFELAADYYPIKYTLTKHDGSTVTGNLDEITDELNANATYHAGEDLTDSLGNFTLTWDWAFEQGYDEADTLLGELAVGEVAGVDASNYNLNANIELIVTVTQVD